MKAFIKYTVIFLLAVAVVICGGVYVGILTSNSTHIAGTSATERVWEQPHEVRNPRALPGVPAPASRTNPDFEANIGQLCSMYANMSNKMLFSARSEGLSRAKMEEMMPNKTKIAADILGHVRDIIYGNKYDYTAVQLSNYVYQYCDFYLHDWYKNKYNQAGGDDTTGLK